MQIHEVVEQQVQKHELDPRHGVRLRIDRVLAPSGTERIVHGDETFDAVDGTFDVPAEVADFYLGLPGWFSGPNPFSEAKPAAQTRSKSKAAA